MNGENGLKNPTIAEIIFGMGKVFNLIKFNKRGSYMNKKIKNKLPDEISIIWHIDDVFEKANEMNIKLTKDQARMILQNVKHDEDANYGVSWDTIENAINFFIHGKY